MAAKLNPRVSQALEQLLPLESGKKLTITSHDNRFELFYEGQVIVEDLTLSDLKTLSRHALKLNIVQLVDVSQLIFAGKARETDAYIKIEDDIARAFLHLISKIKFVKTSVVATPKVEVAT